MLSPAWRTRRFSHRIGIFENIDLRLVSRVGETFHECHRLLLYRTAGSGVTWSEPFSITYNIIKRNSVNLSRSVEYNSEFSLVYSSQQRRPVSNLFTIFFVVVSSNILDLWIRVRFPASLHQNFQWKRTVSPSRVDRSQLNIPKCDNSGKLLELWTGRSNSFPVLTSWTWYLLANEEVPEMSIATLL